MRKRISTLALASILAAAGMAGASTDDQEYKPEPSTDVGTAAPATGTTTDTMRADTMAKSDATVAPTMLTFDAFDQQWCIGDQPPSMTCDVHVVASAGSAYAEDEALLYVPEPIGSWLASSEESSG